MPRNKFRTTAIREIQRDEELVAGHLMRSLGQLLVDVLDNLLLNHTRPELTSLEDRIDQLLAGATAHRRQLNDERIARRGERHNTGDTAPEPARPFSHHGTYLGAFPTLQAVAAHTLPLEAVAMTQLARYDLTGLGLDLHLNGVLWTIDIDGELHAFKPRPREPRDSP